MNKEPTQLSQTKQASALKLKGALQQFPSQQVFRVMQKIFPIQTSTDSTVSLIFSMEKYARTNITKTSFESICNNIWQIINSQDPKIAKVLKQDLIAQVLQPIRVNIKPQSTQSFNPYTQFVIPTYQQQFPSSNLFYPGFPSFAGQQGNYMNYMNFPTNYASNYPNANINSVNQNIMSKPNFGSNNINFTGVQAVQNSNSAGSSVPLSSQSQTQINSTRQNIPSISNVPDANRSHVNAPSNQRQDINININTANTTNSFSGNVQSKIPQSQAQLPSQIYLNKITLNAQSKSTPAERPKSNTLNINLPNGNKSAEKVVKPTITTPKSTKMTILSNPQTNTMQIMERPNSNFQDYFSQSNNIINMVRKQKCICGKDSSTIEIEKEEKFKCYHCEQYYHVNCQRRSNNCLICFLKLMIPTFKVKSQIFVGHLRKNKKKHEMFFEIEDAGRLKDLGLTVQVRCIRVIESTQNINLFPDAVSVEFNKQSVKDFQPLHKQSSLKYRKDQPLTIPQYMLKKSNRIQLTERALGKDNREDRIQSENHIIGIYAVEHQNSKRLAKQIVQNFMSTFKQSKDLLDNSFKLSSQQLSCQVLKIPLTCTLTTEKISIPARGIFCKHFQCFDLQNYISLISMSATPKWFCPLCKKPAYQFVIDSILFEIIKQAPQNKELTHAMFKEDGVFEIFSKDIVIKQGVRNIYDLPIDSKFKRAASQKQVKQETDNKPKKKPCREIPESASIIELSD